MNDKFQLGITAVSCIVLFWAIQTLSALPDRLNDVETSVTQLETHSIDTDRRVKEGEDERRSMSEKLNTIDRNAEKAADAAMYIQKLWERWEKSAQ